MAEVEGLERLASWPRPVDLEPGGARQAAIAKAAQDLVDSNGRQVLDMITLAFGREALAAYERLKASITDADPTFGGEPNDLETRIAACASVAAMLRSKTLAGIAGGGVLSAHWQGLPSPVAELPELAHAALVTASEEARRRLDPSGSVDRVKGFADLAVPADGNPATNQQLHDAIAATATANEQIVTALKGVSMAITVRLAAADEELDVLWWAFSAVSEIASRPWTELEAQDAAVFAGVELSRHVRFRIEIPSTVALFQRVLGRHASDDVELASSLARTWQHLGDVKTPDGHQLLPVLSALSEIRALQGAPAWQQSVTRWGIDAAKASSALDLAHQVVREQLIARWM
jgi:hypothetical protein